MYELQTSHFAETSLPSPASLGSLMQPYRICMWSALAAIAVSSTSETRILASATGPNAFIFATFATLKFKNYLPSVQVLKLLYALWPIERSVRLWYLMQIKS